MQKRNIAYELYIEEIVQPDSNYQVLIQQSQPCVMNISPVLFDGHTFNNG